MKDISMISLKYSSEGREGTVTLERGKISESYLGSRLNRH